MDFTNAMVAAMSKLVTAEAEKVAKGALPVGETPVDFTVRVKGTLKKGADYTQRAVAKADPWLLLAAAFSHLNGVTVASIVSEALNADPALVESLKAGAASAIEALKAPTEQTFTGKVTGKVTAELVA